MFSLYGVMLDAVMWWVLIQRVGDVSTVWYIGCNWFNARQMEHIKTTCGGFRFPWPPPFQPSNLKMLNKITKSRERKQRTNQEHTNILWTYPVADRMIHYKKRVPVHTYISTNKYIWIISNNQHKYHKNDIVTTSNYNTVDNIYWTSIMHWLKAVYYTAPKNGDLQKIIKDGWKLRRWMSWEDPLEYQE